MTRSSRDKINATHILGSIGIAAFFAAVAESWPLFFLVAGALIGASVVTGEIRMSDRRGRSRRNRSTRQRR